MMRWDIINHLIRENNYKSYLEIGYYKGWSFDRIKCDEKWAVDPNPSKDEKQTEIIYGTFSTLSSKQGTKGFAELLFREKSDEFFKAITPDWKWDIFFIDGLHESQQVDRDIQNALKHLSPGGTIVMHDCNPSNYEMTTTGTEKGEWTGDVYKSFVHTTGLKHRYVVNTDYGVGILKPSEMEKEAMIKILSGKFPELDWEEFDKFRDQFLNLISPEEFLKRETKQWEPGFSHT